MTRPGPAHDPDAPRGVDLWLAPFFRDSTLWPVLAVVIMIFVLFGAWGLLLAAFERNVFALCAMVIAFWVSVDVVIRNRRRGGARLIVGCIVGFWALSIGAATVAHSVGWY
jgi:hypothetical protein